MTNAGVRWSVGGSPCQDAGQRERKRTSNVEQNRPEAGREVEEKQKAEMRKQKLQAGASAQFFISTFNFLLSALPRPIEIIMVGETPTLLELAERALPWS